MSKPDPFKPRRFSATTLPWVVGAAALVVYAFTLNPWISLASLEQVARVSGWLLDPELTQPLYFLVTLPLRWMPAAWVPPALNLLNAILAAAVLGLLVRCVALLPHDRTYEQRIREEDPDGLLSFRSAWLPPVLAAAVCGLQLTFWEHATNGTAEMLNLLVFAYIIRCLLEFRITQRGHWLAQASFLWGAGMANNYAMWGFLPGFIIALVWLKRVRFFDLRFLGGMLAFGLAGMSLYLLLPLVSQSHPVVDVGVWQSFKHAVLVQKSVLMAFPKKTVALLALTSVLPVLFIAIKWPKAFGDVTPAGEAISTWVIHAVHLLFLATALWTAFDPVTSPRNAGLGVPFLTFYFLGALAVGYLVGYFLLVFGRRSNEPRFGTNFGRRPSASLLNQVMPPAIWLLAGGVGLGLALRTLPQIRITNGTLVRDYAVLMADQLPDGPVVVYSDDPMRELLLQALLAQRPTGDSTLVVDTRLLNFPQYHAWLAGRHPNRWPLPAPRDLTVPVTDMDIIRLAAAFALTNQLCYAHPSFGYYFEYFMAQPQGLISRLIPYQPEEILAPPLSSGTLETNLVFWTRAERLLRKVEDGLKFRRREGQAERHGSLVSKLFLVNEVNPTAARLGVELSRSLNVWGVQLQRAGLLTEAADCFAKANALNPENVSAAINAQFNGDLQAGHRSSLTVPKRIEDAFDKYRGDQGIIWTQLLNENGPVDEPTFTLRMAETFLRGQLRRQALTEFDRVRTLDPDNYVAQLWHARLNTALGNPAETLHTIDDVRAQPARFALTSTNQLELMFVEASARLAQKERDTAIALVEQALAGAPANTNLSAAALQFFMGNGMLTNALRLLDTHIALYPEDVNALVNKGFIFIQLTNYTAAVEVLSQALALDANSGPARLNRAISHLRLDQLDEAQADYDALVLQFPKAHPIYYGLGEIAWRRRDTNNAIYNYQLFLSNAPPRSPERQEVVQRLEQLTAGQP